MPKRKEDVDLLARLQLPTKITLRDLTELNFIAEACEQFLPILERNSEAYARLTEAIKVVKAIGTAEKEKYGI